MESVFVVLFVVSVGVLSAVWHRKQYWKEEYYACLRDALREEDEMPIETDQQYLERVVKTAEEIKRLKAKYEWSYLAHKEEN